MAYTIRCRPRAKVSKRFGRDLDQSAHCPAILAAALTTGCKALPRRLPVRFLFPRAPLIPQRPDILKPKSLFLGWSELASSPVNCGGFGIRRAISLLCERYYSPAGDRNRPEANFEEPTAIEHAPSREQFHLIQCRASLEASQLFSS